MSSDTHSIPELDRKGLRNFALSNGAIIAVLFGIFLPWLFEFGRPVWPWILALALAVAGLTIPMSLRPVYRGWMRFALLLSKITTPIIMGIIYYLVITPIGLFRRLFARDAMARNKDDSSSYRVASRKPAPGSLKRPF